MTGGCIIKKIVNDDISVPHSSCFCHLLKLTHCPQGVKAETQYT